jgi:hypothetical protein
MLSLRQVVDIATNTIEDLIDQGKLYAKFSKNKGRKLT